MHKLNEENGFSVIEVLLIIVLLVLFGLIGWLVYKEQHKATSYISSNTSAHATKAATNSSNATKTATNSSANIYAGWQTYTSALGGFSFKYPPTGWTLRAFHNDTLSWVTGPAITANENTLVIDENSGQGSSTNNQIYSIRINIGNQSSMSADLGDLTYSQGSVIANLGNGLSLWQTTEQYFNSTSGQKCRANVLAVASDNQLYFKLPNGQYLNATAGFCFGQGQTLNQTYAEQINDPETTIAKDVIASITYN